MVVYWSKIVTQFLVKMVFGVDVDVNALHITRGVTRHPAHKKRHEIGFMRMRRDFNTILKKTSMKK